MSNLKFCNRCKENLPKADFNSNKRNSDKLCHICRDCMKAYQKELRISRKAKGTSAYYDKRMNLKKYGLTVEQFEQMKRNQNNKCAICFGDPNGKGNVLHVDHDHRTGKVRALLCHFCNVGLGHFKEDPFLLLKVIRYLESH